MSMTLNFEPHSYYMGFAIKHNPDVHRLDITQYKWQAFMDDGNTYRIIKLGGVTLSELKHTIRDYYIMQSKGDLNKVPASLVKPLALHIARTAIPY